MGVATVGSGATHRAPGQVTDRPVRGLLRLCSSLPSDALAPLEILYIKYSIASFGGRPAAKGAVVCIFSRRFAARSPFRSGC